MMNSFVSPSYTFEAVEVSAESESSQATPSDDQMPEGRLRYTHKLKKGVTEIKNYGIRMAMLSSLPPPVIHRAMQLAEEIGTPTRVGVISLSYLIRSVTTSDQPVSF